MRRKEFFLKIQPASIHPKFFYTIETVLDRVSSINDPGVIMGEKMSFSEHVDVMVAKALVAMLGFIRRLSLEFREPYTLKSLYRSLVRPKLEYASCKLRVEPVL
jgi:hypothetical protein